MRRKMIAIACSATLIALSACDRSPVARQVGAIPDDSEYGVITAPMTGERLEQPNFDSQAGVTTATRATVPEGTTESLGNKVAPAAGAADSGTTETPAASSGTAEAL